MKPGGRSWRISRTEMFGFNASQPEISCSIAVMFSFHVHQEPRRVNIRIFMVIK